MTLLATQSEMDGPASTPDVEAPPPFIARHPPRVWLVWVALAYLAVVLAVGIVEDPVAHVWYQARQHQLASETGSLRIPDGHQVGVLELAIPSTAGALSIDKYYVVQGDGAAELRGGPAHDPQTPLLGARGNVVIFGHRQDWGAPFAPLIELAPGDQIAAQSVDGYQPTVYTVRSVHVVAAGTTAPLQPSSDYRLTLVTGAGGRFGNRWLVVTAVSGTELPLPRTAVHVGAPGRRSIFLNGPVFGLLVSAGLTVAIAAGLARRFRAGTIAVIIAPVVLCGLLALVLALDRFLAPLA